MKFYHAVVSNNKIQKDALFCTTAFEVTQNDNAG